MHYDRSYDMAFHPGFFAMPHQARKSHNTITCEGRDLNPDARRRQILSLNPAEVERSHQSSATAEHRRPSPPVNGASTTDRTTRRESATSNATSAVRGKRGGRGARFANACQLCNAPQTARMLAGYRVCAWCLEGIAEIAADAEQRVAEVLT